MMALFKQRNCTTAYTWHTPVWRAGSSSQPMRSKRRLSSRASRRPQKQLQQVLIEITYPGTNNFSQLSYDGLGRNTKIVETVSGSVTSTRQFVWCRNLRCEERDGSGGLVKKFFSRGETISGTSYLFTSDSLGSIREMTDASGNIQAQYAFDPFGRVTKLQGTNSADFQFATLYMHSPSTFCMARHRLYNATLGRWLNRDPINESGGINLFRYAVNRPTSVVDPSGLEATEMPLSSFVTYLSGVLGHTVTAADLSAGCVDIVNAALGLPGINQGGSRPDRQESTKCWYGVKARDNAKDYVQKSCGCKGVVWAKKGAQWATPGGTQPPIGPVSPMVLNYLPIDYVTLLPNGQYADLEEGGPASYAHVSYNVNDFEYEDHPFTIWCGTCKKK